ncbi:hypothetical protein KO528_08870 [Saccharophagus degradans]|uniref:hypothetical protein n=1 Tax=Saccharophagus degradans TaxID=86304 RepID=UPI001C081AA6|nr:hypothetical protein [Saccharophagus degradans]MBU2985463.1 hypothetical protein [Saccharophagus degradans]
MSETYIYGGKPVKTEYAEGVKGILIRTINGESLFKVNSEGGTSKTYELRHDDLSVTIDQDALASSHEIDEDATILDHSPSVFGLKPA